MDIRSFETTATTDDEDSCDRSIDRTQSIDGMSRIVSEAFYAFDAAYV